ncbi:MAG: transposase [Herminiimonas sp.]|nr:transposase [Herminiimonas sp.]
MISGEIQLDHVKVTCRYALPHRVRKSQFTVADDIGGYLARSHDPPPGNMVIWRGLVRRTDIELGFTAAIEFVGN